eukprot:42737-Prorocentrum_minimum.AAC.2
MALAVNLEAPQVGLTDSYIKRKRIVQEIKRKSSPPGARVHRQGREFTARGTSSPPGAQVHRQGRELTDRGMSSPPGA